MRFTKSMADEIKGVESQPVVPAPDNQQGVKVNPSGAPADDPEVKLAALLEENAILRRDRDNYRDATLALKGKKGVEDLDFSDPAQVSAFIQKSIQDSLKEQKGVEKETEVIEYAKTIARENKELKLALANRSTAVQNVAAGGGGSAPVAEPQVGYFSPEQKASMEARWKALGIDPAKFPDMMKKTEELAKRTSVGAV